MPCTSEQKLKEHLGTLHVVAAFVLLNGRLAVGAGFGVGE